LVKHLCDPPLVFPACGHKVPARLDNAQYPRIVGAEDGAARAHSLDVHDPERLIAADKREHICTRHLCQRVRLTLQELHAILDAMALDLLPRRGKIGTVAEKPQLNGRVLVSDPREGPNELRDELALDHVAHAQDCPRVWGASIGLDHLGSVRDE
jgi:hypothetical protein